jgi:hypothetical protein
MYATRSSARWSGETLDFRADKSIHFEKPRAKRIRLGRTFTVHRALSRNVYIVNFFDCTMFRWPTILIA